MAANSDRLLQRTSAGYPRLGLTTPWYMAGYDDSRWSTGNGPFGFGSFSGVTLGVNTSTAMQNKLAALYVRKSFVVSAGQSASTNELQLVTRFNDGFIAFVNGVEVARRNMGNPGMFAYRDQTAFNTNVPSAAAITIGLGTASNRLFTGTNVLCIQTHNKSVTSGDLLCMADLRIGGSAPASLVTNSAAWKYFAGASEPSGGLIDYGLINGLPQTVTWATLGYNDSAWSEANGPVGYDRNTPTHYVLGVNLTSQMYGLAASVYTRTVFTATTAEAASSEPLKLAIDYDDGIIVYLNGIEVARRNVGTVNTITPYNTLATVGHGANGEGGATNLEEVITLGAANTLLAGGNNVLSVQTHNNSLTSSDLIGRVTLSTSGASARVLARPTDALRYFIGTGEPQSAGTGEDGGEDIDLDEDTPDSESDWVELYNADATAVNLTGWSLTDDSDKPRKWYFPAGSSIAAGGYLIVMATGFDVGPINGTTYLHTNFKLSSSGEYLGLVDAAGTVVSEIAPTLPAQSYFHSFVRTGTGQYQYSDKATPGAVNTGTWFTAISSPPEFSLEGGFYATNSVLRLTTQDAQAAIRYTLDGSDPSDTNALYTAPLLLSTSTVVRARCYKAGEVPSPIRTATYLVAQSAARLSLPSMCFAATPALGFYGPNAGGSTTNGDGIMAIRGGSFTNASQTWDNYGDMSAFNMPMQKGRSSERPTGFEYYPTSGVPLRTGVGLRISGSPHARPRYKITTAPGARFSPTDFTQKPSFNFFFRGELGDSLQDYPFFPESPVTKFENMRLRAGKNEMTVRFIYDEFTRRIFVGTGQEGTRGNFVSVFLNGVWKGYYNFCEHLREAFMQQHYNSSALWDVLQVGEFASGDAIDWNNTFAFLRTNDLSVASNYVLAQSRIDTDNIIDYVMVNTFAAMWDWPNNNWVAARERSDAGRWRFYMWDAEGSFGADSRNPATYDSFIGDRDGNGVGDDTGTVKVDIGASATNTATVKDVRVVYTRLKSSPEFRLRFADRAQKHFFHGGCMTKESMESVFYPLRDQINPIMKEAANAQINDSYFANWIQATTRRDTYFAQLTKYGLWVATLAPEFSQHGGTVATNTLVAISNPNGTGTIYFTTNGVDPRALGGAVAGTLYTTPLRFSGSAQLKARVLSPGGEWSPLQEADFMLKVNMPMFLLTGSADWTANASWSSAPLPYPNGSNATVLINAPDTADRDISLRAPVTVSSITFFQNDSAFRNKIRDRSTGNTLTFQSTNGPALLAVNGTGAGFVEFEVAADTVLASDLRVEVNDTAGNSEYGALRLRANWRGSGGLIKEGDGVATLTGDSKSYTGPTVINQGVLAFTQPANPFRSTSVSVTSGGQLRMTSASTDGEPRVYAFGGTLTLDSLGRSGTLPPSAQGVSGALRYQPDSDDSTALVTNPVVIAGLSAIHVEGARNTLRLTGTLSGSKGLIKTGSGTLALDAQSSRCQAPVTVSNGTLTVNGRIVSSVSLAPGGRLSGCGQVGAISGSGTVALDRTILSAPIAFGLNYAFVFSTKGSPAYASRTASGNSVLHMPAIQPVAGAAPTIDIYLDTPALNVGDRLRGGFFVESGVDLPGFIDSATVRFFEPDPGGSLTFANRFYSPYSEALPISVTATPETADFGDGPHHGYVMELRVAGPPVRYNEWLQRTFSYPEDQSNPTIAAPLANLQNDGVPNLLKYAFDILPGQPTADHMPRFTLENGKPLYQFRFDPGKNDLVYLVEASCTLSDWPRVLFDSRSDDRAQWSWDGETLILSDEVCGPATDPVQFYRLRVLLADP